MALERYNRIVFGDRNSKESYIPSGRYFDYLVDYINGTNSEGNKGYNDFPTDGVKRYKALLSQSGSNAPTAIVLENTLGEVPTFVYSDIGEYRLTTVGNIFETNKTIVNFQLITSENGQISIYSVSENTILIITYDYLMKGNDNIMNYGTNGLIEVYP